MSNDKFSLDDLDDSKTIEFIKNYLPSELKDKFTEDQLYYFLDLIDDYYMESGIFENAEDDDEIEINLDEIVAFIVKEAKKDKVGEFDSEDIFFVVQGELEYGSTLGMVD